MYLVGGVATCVEWRKVSKKLDHISSELWECASRQSRVRILCRKHDADQAIDTVVERWSSTAPSSDCVEAQPSFALAELERQKEREDVQL